MKLKPFRETLDHKLGDSSFSAAYLLDAAQDADPAELAIAIQHVARARGLTRAQIREIALAETVEQYREVLERFEVKS